MQEMLFSQGNGKIMNFVPIKLDFNRRNWMMKEDMFDYIDKLSGKDFKTLEKIISFPYRKFIRFYRLVESYSGIITKVKYNFISPSNIYN